MRHLLQCLCLPLFLAVLPKAAGITVNFSSSSSGPTVFDSANSSIVANGNLVRVGTLTTPGNPATFLEFGTGTIRSAGVGSSAKPGKLTGAVVNDNGEGDDAQFNNLDVYVWIYNATTAAQATQRGLFRKQGQKFPIDNPQSVADTLSIIANDLITYVADPALGAQGRFDSTVDTNGSGRFVLGSLPVPEVKINEWVADNRAPSGFADPADGSVEDWFELYNPTTAAVDLAGWKLSKAPSAPDAYTIPAGFTVPASGWLMVWADNEPSQNNTALRPHLHVSFTLDDNNGSIRLTSPGGLLMDEVTYARQVPNVSRGRIPDGGTAIDFLTGISPAQSNSPGLGPPQFSMTLEAGKRKLTVPTAPRFLYQIEAGSGLDPAIPWEILLPATEGTGETLEVVEPGEAPRRFYKVVRTP